MTTDTFGTTVLTTDACLALLRSADVGRLAVSIADNPDIFPVNFVVDHGTIVFRAAVGTKLAAAVTGEAVAFEADGFDADAGTAWSVVVKGRAAEVARVPDVFDALDLPLFPWHAAPKHHYVRIEPVHISGRSFQVVGPDHWTRTSPTSRARAAPDG